MYVKHMHLKNIIHTLETFYHFAISTVWHTANKKLDITQCTHHLQIIMNVYRMVSD